MARTRIRKATKAQSDAQLQGDDALPDEVGGEDLAEVVGANLKRIRLSRGLSLERLAGISHVSRAMLNQIELAKTAPSITTMAKIARALQVSLATLLESDASPTHYLIKQQEARLVTSADGAYTARALFPPHGPQTNEFYEVRLAPGALETAAVQPPGAIENIVVHEGRLRLKVGDELFELSAGDAIQFDANQPHIYENPDDKPARLYLVVSHVRET